MEGRTVKSVAASLVIGGCEFPFILYISQTRSVIQLRVGNDPNRVPIIQVSAPVTIVLTMEDGRTVELNECVSFQPQSDTETSAIRRPITTTQGGLDGSGAGLDQVKSVRLIQTGNGEVQNMR